MATRGKRKSEKHLALVRAEVTPASKLSEAASQAVRYTARQECDCRASGAFHAWRDKSLVPAFNDMISISNAWGIPPPGKRAVIEFVTATISVPVGEFARLRMYTSLGTAPSNLDLALTAQGRSGGLQVLTCTHNVRVYSDRTIDFNINRDNAQTPGYALVCVSGYLVDA